MNTQENNTYNRKWYHVYQYCSSCFARNDKHDMNCVECCPVKNGKQPDTLYENQDELKKAMKKAMKKIAEKCGGSVNFIPCG